jgi:predicted transglutaminase-like protease
MILQWCVHENCTLLKICRICTTKSNPCVLWILNDMSVWMNQLYQWWGLLNVGEAMWVSVRFIKELCTLVFLCTYNCSNNLWVLLLIIKQTLIHIFSQLRNIILWIPGFKPDTLLYIWTWNRILHNRNWDVTELQDDKSQFWGKSFTGAQ